MSGATEQPAEAPAATRGARPFGTYVRRPRSLVPPSYGRVTKHPLQAALVWLLPWGYHQYPGFRRGSLQVLGERVTWAAVIKWGKRDRWPQWAVRLVRNAVAARVASGQALLDDLDGEIAIIEQTPVRNVGLCVIQADGRDRRGNWRR